MGKSKIEWTGSTWNPIRARNKETGQVGTWCQKVSPGCTHCYAATINSRNLPKVSSGLPYSAQGGAKAEIFLDSKILREPLKRRKPETYFVCSMSDLFMERVPYEMIAAVYGVMAACPQHTFQVLTKRPERRREFFVWAANQGEELLAAIGEAPPTGTPIQSALAILAGGEEMLGRAGERKASLIAGWPLNNVWEGVSVESEEYAGDRIMELLETPAVVRFLSCEPLLGQIDLTRVHSAEFGVEFDALHGFADRSIKIDWVIIGGESGCGARPFDLRWARDIIAQCRAAGVPIFMKQVGSHPIVSHPADLETVPDAFRGKGGDPNHWPVDLRIRQMPTGERR